MLRTTPPLDINYNEINTLIWDWNGTLLNDVEICIDTINALLTKRNLKPLTKDTYREIFTFPVIEYYRQAGFNFNGESFDEVAIEFIDLYKINILQSEVFTGVNDILGLLQRRGYGHFMISAMQHDFLNDLVSQHDILHHFEAISGIQDHYANGKKEMATRFLREHNIDRQTALIIGDTLHDYEVAEDLGIRCLLTANGHQSFKRLLSSGCNVINTLSELPGLLGIR